MPRIEKIECSLDETRGKNKTDLPTKSKWQIGLFLWQKTARVQASAQHQRGRFLCTGGIPKGGSPWRFFGDFLIGEKVTRVQGGAPASQGLWGQSPPLGGAGAKSDDLLPRGPPPPRPSVGWNPTDPTPSGHSPDPETPACCKASSPADSLGKPPGGTAWPAGRPQTATQKSGGRSPCRGSRG